VARSEGWAGEGVSVGGHSRVGWGEEEGGVGAESTLGSRLFERRDSGQSLGRLT